MLKNKKNNVESFIKKEIDIKTENKKIEYTNKDVFFNSMKIINSKLDFTRNAIFNIIVSSNYVNEINFNFDIEIKNINKIIVEIENNIEQLLKKINIKFEKEKN